MKDEITDYKKLSAELDSILEELQTADIDVDESMRLYQRGMTVARELEKYVQTAENKITKLKQSFENN